MCNLFFGFFSLSLSLSLSLGLLDKSNIRQNSRQLVGSYRDGCIEVGMTSVASLEGGRTLHLDLKYLRVYCLGSPSRALRLGCVASKELLQQEDLFNFPLSIC